MKSFFEQVLVVFYIYRYPGTTYRTGSYLCTVAGYMKYIGRYLYNDSLISLVLSVKWVGTYLITVPTVPRYRAQFYEPVFNYN